jgi:hypothetical protein
MKNLWLGAEYNQNYGDTESTDELMRQYLNSGTINKNTSFFVRLKAQVSCFGNPNDFCYDDVSRVRASGKHTKKDQFESNVSESVDYHKDLFRNHKPRVILIGGSQAYDAWCKFILRHLVYDNLFVVKIRNPSRQAHRGNSDEWLNKYQQFKADLSQNVGLKLLHLKCSNIKSDFKLIEIPPDKFIK